MLKRFWSILLGCLMISCAALGETADNEYIPLSSLDGFYGLWTSCGSNDSCPYLVLHADGTYEHYDYWQLDDSTVSGDALMKRGTYTFNAADSTFMFEGNETVYTAKTAPAGEDYENSIGELTAAPGQPMLLLEVTDLPEDAFGDPSLLFLPMTAEDMALLPSQEALWTQEPGWAQSDVLQASDEAALPRWQFREDGTFSLVDPARADRSLSGTYTYDNGLLTVAAAGQTQRLLLQYAHMPIPTGEEEDPAEPFSGAVRFFDYDSEAAYNSAALLSSRLLVVHDLDQGTLSYWMGALE